MIFRTSIKGASNDNIELITVGKEAAKGAIKKEWVPGSVYIEKLL